MTRRKYSHNEPPEVTQSMMGNQEREAARNHDNRSPHVPDLDDFFLRRSNHYEEVDWAKRPRYIKYYKAYDGDLPEGRRPYRSSPYLSDANRAMTNNTYSPVDITDSNSLKLPESKPDMVGVQEAEEAKPKEDNTWKVSDTITATKPWAELPGRRKCRRGLWNYSLRYLVLFALLYLSLCALDLLGSAFRLFGGFALFTGGLRSWGKRYDVIIENPIACLTMGMLGTVLVQSSSVTTVLAAKMATDKLLPVQAAVCVVIGANLGTSLTPALASLTHLTDRKKFSRAFAGAALHTSFNFLTVLIFFPIEAASGMLYHLTSLMVKPGLQGPGHEIKYDPLHIITQPFNQFIVQLNEAAVSDNRGNSSLVKHVCNITIKDKVPEYYWVTKVIDGLVHSFEKVRYSHQYVNTLGKCRFLFGAYANTWPDWLIGLALFLLAMAIFWVCILLAVLILRQVVRGQCIGNTCVTMSTTSSRKTTFLAGLFFFVLGLAMTLLLQSSSVIIIIGVVFLGRGIISIQRMYILTASANIGTTFTAIFSSLATGSNVELQLALCHLIFNFVGFCLWFLAPFFRKIPLYLAKRLGNIVGRFRWYAVVHIVLCFIVIPTVVFLLCLAGWIVLVAVGVPFISLVVFIIVLNIIQHNKPSLLPAGLKTWDCLPKWMHSLKPYDRGFTFCGRACREHCCCCCRLKQKRNKLADRSQSMETWQDSRVKLYFSDCSNTGTLRSCATSRDTLRSNLGVGNSRDTLRSMPAFGTSRDTLRSIDQPDYRPPSRPPLTGRAPLAKIDSEDDESEVYTISEGKHTFV